MSARPGTTSPECPAARRAGRLMHRPPRLRPKVASKPPGPRPRDHRRIRRNSLINSLNGRSSAEMAAGSRAGRSGAASTGPGERNAAQNPSSSSAPTDACSAIVGYTWLLWRGRGRIGSLAEFPAADCSKIVHMRQEHECERQQTCKKKTRGNRDFQEEHGKTGRKEKTGARIAKVGVRFRFAADFFSAVKESRHDQAGLGMSIGVDFHRPDTLNMRHPSWHDETHYCDCMGAPQDPFEFSAEETGRRSAGPPQSEEFDEQRRRGRCGDRVRQRRMASRLAELGFAKSRRSNAPSPV